MSNMTSGSSQPSVKTLADAVSVLTCEVSDEALEAAVGDFREVKCSQCGGSCNSSCSTSTR